MERIQRSELYMAVCDLHLFDITNSITFTTTKTAWPTGICRHPVFFHFASRRLKALQGTRDSYLAILIEQNGRRAQVERYVHQALEIVKWSGLDGWGADETRHVGVCPSLSLSETTSSGFAGFSFLNLEEKVDVESLVNSVQSRKNLYG